MQKKNKEYRIYLYFLKWRIRIMGGLAAFLLKNKITANMITLFRLCLVIPVVIYVRDFPLIVAGALVLNLVLDGLDGVMARMDKKDSYEGSVFDALVDNFFEIPLVLALIFFNMTSEFLAALYLTALLLNHFSNYFRYGWGPGKYKFSYGKYFVYLSVLILGVINYNMFDIVFVFWSVFFLVFVLDNIHYFVKNAGIFK